MPADDDVKKWSIDNVLQAMAAWFPDLPRWCKVTLSLMLAYSIICMFLMQVSPADPFRAAGQMLQGYVSHERELQAEDRSTAAAERADLIGLLMEQNRELRNQAAKDPDLASRVSVLERKMATLLDQHPKARERARAPPE